tara:strand:- start:4762 stop:6447 length:1686 start_codon:yes stop_codon:yes gene_type:complete
MKNILKYMIMMILFLFVLQIVYSQPNLNSPMQGHVTDDTSIILSWNITNNNTNSEVYVSQDNGFSDIFYQTITNIPSTTVNDLTPSTYYWKVKYNQEWSDTWNFIVNTCVPNWIMQNTQCQTNDQILITYTDSKNCNNEINLPNDHNTYTNCNYCSLDLEILYSDWSECDANNQKTRTKEYTNLNYDSCCAITGFTNDCLNSTSNNLTDTVNCNVQEPENETTQPENQTTPPNNQTTQNITNDTSCLSNWVQVVGDCQEDESRETWFYDSNLCTNETKEHIINELSCDYDNNGYIGDADNLNTTISNLSFISGVNIIEFKQNNKKLIEFDKSNETINFKNIVIEKASNESLIYILIKGLDLGNNTKTVYIDNNNKTSFCIKDAEISSITEISSLCNDNDEVGIICPGSVDQYECSYTDETNTSFKITGLSHSGIKQQGFCGDGICDESCSFCSTDCGTCPVNDNNDGGGSSSGSSGGGYFVKKEVVKEVEHTEVIDNPTQSFAESQKDIKGLIIPKVPYMTGAVVGTSSDKSSLFLVSGFVVLIMVILGLVLIRRNNTTNK